MRTKNEPNYGLTRFTGGQIINFLNPDDFALATGTVTILGVAKKVSWEANQESYKPDTGFAYYDFSSQGYRLRGDGSLFLLTDPREIMAFCARPHAQAAGALPGVHGVIGGSEVNLKTSFGFGGNAADHSGEFNRNIQVLGGFYRQLELSLRVVQP